MSILTVKDAKGSKTVLIENLGLTWECAKQNFKPHILFLCIPAKDD